MRAGPGQIEIVLVSHHTGSYRVYSSWGEFLELGLTILIILINWLTLLSVISTCAVRALCIIGDPSCNL